MVATSDFNTYSHHAWCSFEGAAEIYNEMVREAGSIDAINTATFLRRWPIRRGMNLHA